MSCDVGKATEGLQNELRRRWCDGKLEEWAPQAFRHFTYVRARSATLPTLYLRHNSFSNLYIASPTSQLILQPFFRFSYVTSSSLTSPGEPTMYVRAMTSHDACTSETSRSSHSSKVEAVEDGCSYSSSRRLWSAICNKGLNAQSTATPEQKAKHMESVLTFLQWYHDEGDDISGPDHRRI